MRELLEQVAAGDCSPAAAEAQLRGYTTDSAGRFDAARTDRTGIPEGILADGKTTAEIAALALEAIDATGHALITRLAPDAATAVETQVTEEFPDAELTHDARARTVVVHAPSYDAPEFDATVGIVTAGTSDAVPAGEAAVVAREMGASVTRVDDVGVAGIHRLFDSLETIRDPDVLIVAAGREGALPTVVAGLVDAPVIGLPVSNGYGHAGKGEAALAGMIQSCTPLSVVNIDAGFVAGSQAGLIARAVGAARGDQS